jgi:hypothetical protein
MIIADPRTHTNQESNRLYWEKERLKEEMRISRRMLGYRDAEKRNARLLSQHEETTR